MSRLDLPLKVYGRPLKPLALSVMLSMVVIAVINVLDVGLAADHLWGDFIGLLAAVSAAAMAGGWFARSQSMAEVGMLIAAGVWMVRGVFALLYNGSVPIGYGWAFSFCWALAAGGAYMLERVDDSEHKAG